MEDHGATSKADTLQILIRRNNATDSLSGVPNLEVALEKLSHVRLDREGITCLDSTILLRVPNVTNLYLQKNLLTSFKGLEVAKQLRFLTIAGNRITTLSNLKSLSKLVFFDASENLISHINVDLEIPLALRFLNISQNPCCTQQFGLRDALQENLLDLRELIGFNSKAHQQHEISHGDTADDPSSYDSFMEALQNTTTPVEVENLEENASGTTSVSNSLDAQGFTGVQEALHGAGSIMTSVSESMHDLFDQKLGAILECSRLRIADDTKATKFFFEGLNKLLSRFNPAGQEHEI